MRGNDTVNGIITCKPRLQARFGSTVTNYDFTSPRLKVGVKGEAKYRHKTRHTGRRT